MIKGAMLRAAVAVFLAFAAGADFASGSDPRLTVISPRGVQRGGDHVLRFSGARIGDAEQVFLYQSGVTINSITKVDDNNVDVAITVASDCSIGQHLAQLRTPRGISDYRPFYVGIFPGVAEVEPNNDQDAAQAIELNVTCSGTITSEDVDCFRIALRKGERLSVEIEAIRLGYLFDPYLAILDERKFEVASNDDSPLFGQDSAVSFLAPEDGIYTILVRESSYGGNEGCAYRLHVGDFVRPTAIVPAGGKPGEQIPVTTIGDPGGPFETTVQTPADANGTVMVDVANGENLAPSQFRFRASALPNHLENGQLADWPLESAIALPAAFNGVIAVDGEVDWYLFSGRKGEIWDIEVYAKRLGSACDPVINVFNHARAHIAGNDDSRGQDAWMRFTVPEDGAYYLRVKDHLDRGSADNFYRVELTAVEPKVEVSIPRIDRYSQTLQTISVPAGNHFATVLNVTRGDVSGVVEVLAESLPPGITMDARPTEGNHNQLPVLFSAAADAAPSGALVDLQARLTAGERTVEGRFTNFADFANGEPNNVVYYGASVDRLAVAVTKAAPFRIEIQPPSVPLVRDGSINLKVKAIRDEGFNGKIFLRFPFRPPGVGTNYQMEIPEGQSEIEYPLNANANAAIGKWPVFVVAFSPVDGGNLWLSSPLTEVSISEPFLRITAARSAADQGKTAKVLCDIEQVSPFEGEARIELTGLPPGSTASPQTVNSTVTQVVFDVNTTAETPLGSHKSLFCQVFNTIGADTSVGVTGRTELQITQPAPVAVAPPAAAPPEASPPAPPAEKPLTRLEQLRAMKANGSGTNE